MLSDLQVGRAFDWRGQGQGNANGTDTRARETGVGMWLPRLPACPAPGTAHVPWPLPRPHRACPQEVGFARRREETYPVGTERREPVVGRCIAPSTRELLSASEDSLTSLHRRVNAQMTVVLRLECSKVHLMWGTIHLIVLNAEIETQKFLNMILIFHKEHLHHGRCEGESQRLSVVISGVASFFFSPFPPMNGCETRTDTVGVLRNIMVQLGKQST